MVGLHINVLTELFLPSLLSPASSTFHNCIYAPRIYSFLSSRALSFILFYFFHITAALALDLFPNRGAYRRFFCFIQTLIRLFLRGPEVYFPATPVTSFVFHRLFLLFWHLLSSFPDVLCFYLWMALISRLFFFSFFLPSFLRSPAGFCSQERPQGSLLKEHCQTVALQLGHTHTHGWRCTDLQLRCRAVARGLQAAALTV